MIRFDCDYIEGAHPKILEKFLETNLEQTVGYGEDDYCRRAADKIRALCGSGTADVHFFVGGTQVNLTVLSAALRPHQGALAADTGHINSHESGAIEATGHKVLPLQNHNGKITAAQIQEAVDRHYGDGSREHIVQPKLVYISDSTESGSIYYKAELEAISAVCRRNGLFLYLDGARLGSALCAEDNDLALPDLCRLCDTFYIGGTKNGALFGEALVITNEFLKQDFRYILKQKGGMLAKGRLLGLQFLTLFEDGLYFEMAKHANRMAGIIKKACEKKGYPFLARSTTNQQFPVMPNGHLKKLSEEFVYSEWLKVDSEHTCVRFCTSWATDEANVRALAQAIESL